MESGVEGGWCGRGNGGVESGVRGGWWSRARGGGSDAERSGAWLWTINNRQSSAGTVAVRVNGIIRHSKFQRCWLNW